MFAFTLGRLDETQQIHWPGPNNNRELSTCTCTLHSEQQQQQQRFISSKGKFSISNITSCLLYYIRYIALSLRVFAMFARAQSGTLLIYVFL